MTGNQNRSNKKNDQKHAKSSTVHTIKQEKYFHLLHTSALITIDLVNCDQSPKEQTRTEQKRTEQNGTE